MAMEMNARSVQGMCHCAQGPIFVQSERPITPMVAIDMMKIIMKLQIKKRPEFQIGCRRYAHIHNEIVTHTLIIFSLLSLLPPIIRIEVKGNV